MQLAAPESALALSSLAKAVHKTTDASAVGLLPLQKTSRQSQTALFRPLLLCCRGSAGSISEQVGQSQTAIFRLLLLCCRGSACSIQEQAGQVKQHYSGFSCCVAGAVQALAMSPDCALLATAAQDNTVFLFTVASPTVYEPVGFFRLKQPASCMTWAPDSTKLLIGCRLEQLLA